MTVPVVVLRERDGLLTSAVTTVSIGELFAWRREARATMLAAMAGDEAARAEVESVVNYAHRAPTMQRGRAVIMAHVMNEVFAEIREEMAAAEQAQAPQYAPPPPQAAANETTQQTAPPVARPAAPSASVEVSIGACGHPTDIACACAKPEQAQSAEAS